MLARRKLLKPEHEHEAKDTVSGCVSSIIHSYTYCFFANQGLATCSHSYAHRSIASYIRALTCDLIWLGLAQVHCTRSTVLVAR